MQYSSCGALYNLELLLLDEGTPSGKEPQNHWAIKKEKKKKKNHSSSILHEVI